MRILTIIFLSIFTYCSSFAQQKKIDSLTKVLQNYKKEDTVKASLMHTLGMSYIYSSPKKTLQYSKDLAVLGNKINNFSAKFASIELEAAYYLASLKLDSAVMVYEKMKTFGKLNNNNRPLFAANGNLANILLMRGKAKEAIVLQKELLAIPETDELTNIAKGRVYVNLANAYNVIGERTLALETALKGLEVNTKIGDDNSVSAANYLIGSLYGISSQFNEALKYHLGYVAIQTKLGNWTNVCSGLLTVATDYKQLNKPNKALEIYEQAERIAKKYELIAIQNKIATNLSSFSEIMLTKESEIDKLLELKNNFETNSLTQDLAHVLMKLSIGYHNVSATYLAKKGLDKKSVDALCLSYLKQATDIGLVSNNYGIKEEALRSTSVFYEQREDFGKAFFYFQKYIILRDSAINESKQVEINRLVLQNSFDRKEDSLKLIQYSTKVDLEKQYFLNNQQQQSLVIKNNEIEFNKQTILTNNQNISILAKDKELQHLAYLKTQADLQTVELLKAEKETQLNLLQNEKLLEMVKVKNLSQENELNKQVNELNKYKRKQLIGYGIAALSTVLFAAFFFYNRSKTKQRELKVALEKEKAEQQIKEAEFQKSITDVSLSALRSQMNPHFIFNCLNSIKLYTAQNDTVAASNYLTKFSKLIRMALENSRSETVNLQSELQSLELYIQLEAMRFKGKLKYAITVDENVATDFIEIPPMLLQPYVENAIWHGLMQKDDGGNIDINIKNTVNNKALIISIKDDGIGRAEAAKLNILNTSKHKSFGTKVTSERLALINKLYNTEASVITEDVIENNKVAGTLVTITIPFED